VIPPASLPASAPASIIDLRIGVLQAIKAYESSKTAESLAALQSAHMALRTAIMAHRVSTGGRGYGWGRKHGRRQNRRWGASPAFKRGYGYGGWGSTPPGGVVAAAAPAAIVQPTAPASNDPSARNLMGFGCCGLGEFSRGAGMMYADDPMAREVDNQMNGTLESLAHSVGISSNLSHWESGVPLPQVYEKYAAWIPSLTAQAKGILGSGERDRLAQKAGALYRIWNPLRNAFSGGAIAGERDRNRLDELVGATRQFKKDLEKAKKEWGWAPVPEEEVAPEPVPQGAVPAPSTGGFPTWMLLIPFSLIAMTMFGKRK
jgi:hypothetical protein